MKILVCGAGQVGGNIAIHLSQEGHDVTVIDNNQSVVDEINQNQDIHAVFGHSSHPDSLKMAGAEKADLIIAATQSDEINMVTCQMAHTLFKIPKKIARIRSQVYKDPVWANLFGREHMPIDAVISPETEVAKAIIEQLGVPGAFNVISLEDDQIHIVGLVCDETCPLLNTPLKHFPKLFPDLDFKIVCIIRDHDVFTPEATDQILSGDKIYFIAHHEQTSRVMGIFGHETIENRNIILIGGGNVGESLAEYFTSHSKHSKIKLIENSKQRSIELANKLENTVVLRGDALNVKLLKEANISKADVAISITNDDRTNILSALLAKEYGAKRVLSLVNQSTYGSIIENSGLDSIINPRAVTVSTILQYIRKGKITAVRRLYEGDAEIIEIEATDQSKIINIPLRNLSLPKNLIIAALVRDNILIIPNGDDEVRSGDRAILIDINKNAKEIENLFVGSAHDIL